VSAEDYARERVAQLEIARAQEEREALRIIRAMHDREVYIDGMLAGSAIGVAAMGVFALLAVMVGMVIW